MSSLSILEARPVQFGYRLDIGLKETKKQRMILDFRFKDIGDWWLCFGKQRRLEEEHALSFKGR